MRFRELAGVAVLVLAGCGSRAGNASRPPAPAAPSAARTAAPLPVHVRGVGNARTPAIMSDTKDGRRIYTIRALQFEGDIAGVAGGTAQLEQPHVTFLDKNNAPTIADAPKATVRQRDKSVLMTGGVRARTADGGVLTCDSLRYDAGSERFDGEGHVRLSGPNGVELDGDHLDGDVRLHDVKVTSGGRG